MQQKVSFQDLNPLTLLERSAFVYPGKTAVVYGSRRYTYHQFSDRVKRLAGALKRVGVEKGDRVAFLAPNGPPMLEGHYGPLYIGAVLVALNYRLSSREIAYIINHCGAKVLVFDSELAPIVRELKDDVPAVTTFVQVVDVAPKAEDIPGPDYESFLASAPEGVHRVELDSELETIAIDYTSGTTGQPKGVEYNARGAYLAAISEALEAVMSWRSVYLWTLPMFHCNGWSYTWGVTAVGGTHVCLRNPDPAQIFPLIDDHAVTHMCGAPIIMNMLAHAPDDVKKRFDTPIEVATGGAAPPSTVIEAMEAMGFNVTHLYGLTECYGPSTFAAPQPDWADLETEERARLMARQGVRYPTISGHMVLDPETMAPVPADGETIGELMLQGNTVMKGYLKNPKTTAEAFADGWFHTGDLGVVHADGYVEIKDRSKDIILSGGENISSLEVEEALYKHPKVMEAAVVGRPHEKWGEGPCAFVTLTADAGEVTAEEIIQWCKDHLARFKAPHWVVFGPLPKTSTGKIQKFVLRERALEL